MVKLFTLISIFVFSSTFIHAQITKGSVLLGGSIGYSNSSIDSDDNSNISKARIFSIRPSLGVAIKENLIFGGELGFSSHLNETANKSTSTSYGAGVFMRKYFSIANRFYFFGQASLGANIGHGETTQGVDFKTTSKSYNVNSSIYPGVSFQVNKKLHLETSFNNLVNIQYNKLNTEIYSFGNLSTSTSKSFSVGSSLNNISGSGLYVGFRLLLAK